MSYKHYNSSSNNSKSYSSIKSSIGQLNLTGKLLAKNTILNILGSVIPLPIVIITIPYIIDGIGIERFGLLSIVWMMIGYFNVFDFGISRTVTKFMAEFWTQKKNREISDLIVPSIIILIGCGIIIGLVLAIFTNWIVTSFFNIPPHLINETRKAFYLLSIAVPIMILITGASGILEALQQFRIINLIKVSSTVATFTVPLIVMLFSKNLYPIVGMLVFCKLLTLMFFSYFCWKNISFDTQEFRITKSSFLMLLSFGRWMGISNIVAPLMGRMDRFYIGSILTISAVTYYATPFDLITKLFVIPTSLLAVVFPVFSSHAVNDSDKFSMLYVRSIKYILIAMTPTVLLLIVLSKTTLTIWLGEDFASQSTFVMQVLAVGVLYSSIARVPFNAIQASGHPGIIAKLVLIELPIYMVALFYLTTNYGIVGTVVVWSMRAMLEMNILFVLVYYKIPEMKKNIRINSVVINLWVLASVSVAFSLSYIPHLFMKSLILLPVLCMLLYLSYVFWLDNYERSKMKNIFMRLSEYMKSIVS